MVIWWSAKNPDVLASALSRITRGTVIYSGPIFVKDRWYVWIQSKDVKLKSGDID